MPKNVSVEDTQEVLKEEPVTEEVAEATETETEESILNNEEWDSYSQDPELEIWDGGPTIAQINEWKDAHGDVFVTALTETKYVVWRTLTRFEYRTLTAQLEKAVSDGQRSQSQANMDNEDAIAELCVLYPKYSRNQNEMAGVATTIANQVMEASAFAPLEVRQL